jgi:hypothetical protein
VRIDKEGDIISLHELMAKALFTRGMEGLDAVLEAYSKTVVLVTLSDKAPKMNYNDSVTVTFVKENSPPCHVHSECLNDYEDVETHNVTRVYKKRPEDVLRGRENDR